MASHACQWPSHIEQPDGGVAAESTGRGDVDGESTPPIRRNGRPTHRGVFRAVFARRGLGRPYRYRVTTFALVDGSWHGAWCWERLAPLLRQAGHDVVAMDLPTDDTSTTCDTFADVICSALDERGDDVVLVGHSYGGFVIPLVAARRPVRHLVYVCAYYPCIGRSVDDQLRDEPDIFNPAGYAGLVSD
jgi:hypothetical protein